MKQTVLILIAALTSVVAVSAAQADEVVLRNGDRLHGQIVENGPEVVLEHPVLGEVRLLRSDCKVLLHDRCSVPGTLPSTPSASCPSPTPDPIEEVCPSPWSFMFTVGFSNESGNTEKTTFNTDLEARHTRGRGEWQARWRANYETAQGVQTEGNVNGLLLYTRHFTARDAWWASGIYTRDDFADILLRNGWFAGYRRDFVKTQKTTFYGAVGAGGAIEKRKGEPTLTTATAWAGLGYTQTFSEGDSFTARAYTIPYLDRVEWSPSHVELRYAHPLRETLDLTASFFWDWVPNPPGDIKAHDTKFVLGLRWSP